MHNKDPNGFEIRKINALLIKRRNNMARGHCEVWFSENNLTNHLDELMDSSEIYDLAIDTFFHYIDFVNGKEILTCSIYDSYEFGIEDTKDGEVLCHVSEIKEDRLKPDILIIGNDLGKFEIISFPELGFRELSYNGRDVYSKDYADKKDYKELDELMTNRLLELKNSGKGYLVTIIYHF